MIRGRETGKAARFLPIKKGKLTVLGIYMLEFAEERRLVNAVATIFYSSEASF